jgi:hypothetical protein
VCGWYRAVIDQTCFTFRPFENNFNLTISCRLTHRDKNWKNFLFIDPRMDLSKSRCDEANFPKMDQSDWWVFQYKVHCTFSDITQKWAEWPMFFSQSFQNRNNFLTEKYIFNAIEIFSNIFFSLIWPGLALDVDIVKFHGFERNHCLG